MHIVGFIIRIYHDAGHLNVKNRYQPFTLTLLIPFFLPFPTSSPHNFHFTIIGQYFIRKILNSVCIVNWGIHVGRASLICFFHSARYVLNRL